MSRGDKKPLEAKLGPQFTACQQGKGHIGLTDSRNKILPLNELGSRLLPEMSHTSLGRWRAGNLAMLARLLTHTVRDKPQMFKPLNLW